MAWLAGLGLAAGRWAGQGLDLLYPRRCVFCRAEESEAAGTVAIVCDLCRRLLVDHEPRCSRCGEPMPVIDEDKLLMCTRCHHRPRFDGIAILAGYDDAIRSAILTAKRPGGELHAAGLATLLLERHRETIASWQLDLVVPVPMHWRRRMTRGTSSADGLARHLAKGLGLPSRGLLWRTRATPMQNELPPEARAANVHGAFHATSAAEGKRIMLVDDVTTTGSTLDACRDALVRGGAVRVHAAVVARADRGGSSHERGPRS